MRVPSGEQRGVALLDHRQLERGADQLAARAAGERAEGIVDVGDAAVAVAAHDHVALRFEEALRALLGLPEFPVAVGAGPRRASRSSRSSSASVRLRENSSPTAPQAAPNRAAAPIANVYGS